MSKILIAIIIGLTSSMALAEDNFPWELISHSVEKANNPTQFKALQKKYPETFGNQNPKHVVSANIELFTYEYVGETICLENDPRLIFKTSAHGVCSKAGGPVACYQTAPAMIGTTDPCAE